MATLINKAEVEIFTKGKEVGRKEFIEEFEKILFQLGFTEYNNVVKRQKYIEKKLQELKLCGDKNVK